MCLNFLLVKIGCDNDNTIKIDTSILTDVMNTTVQSFENDARTQITTFQQLTFQNAETGVVACQNLTVGQTTNITSSTVNTFINQQLATITNNIADKVEDKLTQSQTQGLLNFLNNLSQSGSLTNSQDITNAVKEVVRNTVRQTAINTLWAGTKTAEVLTIINRGTITGETCNFVQSDLLNIRVTNLAQNIQSSLQSNQFLNNLLIYSKQTQDSGSFLRWLIIGAVIIGVLIIVGIILYLLFGGSKTAVKPDQLAGLVKPGVRVCEAKAKMRLAEEGRTGDRNAELFMIDRCLKERKAEERFRKQPQSFSKKAVGTGESEMASGSSALENAGTRKEASSVLENAGQTREGSSALENAGRREFDSSSTGGYGSSARRFSEKMKGYAKRFSEGYGGTAARAVEEV